MANEKQGLFTRLFGAKQETRSNVATDLIPLWSETQARQPVSVVSALSISAVYAAVNILGTWIAQMDLEVQRAGEAIALPALVAQPDTDCSQSAFLKQTVTSGALTGEAFWKVTYSRSSGLPMNVRVLNPYSVSIETKDNGSLIYKVANANSEATYTSREVKHIKFFEVPGRVRGLGPIEANTAGLNASLELRRYADNWFNGSGVPKGGYLKSDQALDTDELTEARTRWLKQMNDGLPPAMGQGFDYQTVNLSPADAMFLEQQTFAVTEIARWFGIPPYLLLASVDGNSMTYSNLQTDTRLFVTNTLMTYMMPIADALSALLPRGQVVKFKTEALLRGDTQERYEAYRTAIEAGFLLPNEVRSMEGWAALPVSDEPPAANPPATPITQGGSTEQDT